MRHIVRRRPYGTGIFLAAAALMIAGSAAYADTPPGEAIPATECTVEPRSADFLATLVQTPAPEQPEGTPTPVPSGRPADEKTTQEITAAVREYIACINGGEYLRAFALYDDAFLRRVIDPTGELKPEIAAEIGATFATPTPLEPKDLIYLVAIREIRQLPDGRVAAIVETASEASGDDHSIDLFVYEKRDDRWLIVDAVQGYDPNANG